MASPLKKITDINVFGRFLPRFLKSPSKSSHVALYKDDNGNIHIGIGQTYPTPISNDSVGSAYFDYTLKVFIMNG